MELDGFLKRAIFLNRKHMENRKPPTEQIVADWLAKGRLALPPLRLRLVRLQPRYAGPFYWDFEIEARWAGQKATFAAEYKPLSTPQTFQAILQQCRGAPLPSGKLPLMILPYLRHSQLEDLEQLGLSGIDLCGNGVVIIPGKLWVLRSGAPNQFSTSAPIKNIYRKNTSMVARLLTDMPTLPNVRTVRDEVNVRNPFVRNGARTPMRLGTVSKALKGLEEDLIIERSGVIRLLQAEKLLSQLVENYQPPHFVRRKRMKVKLTGPKLWRLLRDRSADTAIPLAATGLSSVGRYAVMARDDVLSLYCPRPDQLQQALGAIETDQFPNVELIETEDEPLFFDAREEDAIPWASPLQTYLELMAGDKRDQEVAQQVKSLLLRTMKSGKK